MGKIIDKVKPHILPIFLFMGICISLLWSTKVLIEDYPQRILNINIFDFYDAEGFCLLKNRMELGERLDADIPNRKEIGPLPDGKIISAYVKNGEIIYNEPYEHEYYIDVPYYKFDPQGLIDFSKVTTHHKRMSETRYIKRSITYDMIFSVYDISDLFSIFESRDSAYKRIRNGFLSKLNEYDNWEYNPLDYKSDLIKASYRQSYEGREKAISYNTITTGGTIAIRSIYFANKKAYVLEVHSNKRATEIANSFLSNITTLDLSGYNKRVLWRVFYGLYVFMAFSLILFLICRNKYKRKPVINKIANVFFRYTLCMTFVNFAILLFIHVIRVKLITNNEYLHEPIFYDLDLRVWAYMTILSLTLFNLLPCIFLYWKCKTKKGFCFMVPKKLMSYIDDRVDNSKERKTLVLLLFIPLFLLGPIPYGSLILLYVIPFAIIIFIVLEVRKLYRWINKEVKVETQENTIFKDYYVILNLNRGATETEIDKAFNLAIAKYNFANGNPLYGTSYYTSVQEAYAVLSSTNQLRPEYDKEYERYKLGGSTNYSYSNIQLENEIRNIRHRLYGMGDGYKGAFMIYLITSIAVLLIIAIVILFLTDVIPLVGVK